MLTVPILKVECFQIALKAYLAVYLKLFEHRHNRKPLTYFILIQNPFSKLISLRKHPVLFYLFVKFTEAFNNQNYLLNIFVVARLTMDILYCI